MTVEDPSRITQSQVLQAVAPSCGSNGGPFGTTRPAFGLMDYARIVGTPVGKTGAILSGLICDDDHCSRGIILTLSAAVGWYGYTRKDALGWGLVVSAAGAALYTLLDVPRVVPAGQQQPGGLS
jgi:hypothetical protein